MGLRNKLAQYKEYKNGVSHCTFNPEGPGVVRIHLIPPKFRLFKNSAYIVILNGYYLLPIGYSWALVLSNFMKEVNRFDGKPIAPEKRRQYIMLNKPQGVVTTLSDPQGRKTVRDLITDIPERIYPVGRLDYDTEGLLLLTNDGELMQNITHPSKEVEKLYVVRVRGVLTEQTEAELAALCRKLTEAE